MQKQKSIKIFFVDDDRQYMAALTYQLVSNPGLNIRYFPSGEDCIRELHQDPDMILLDYFLDGEDEYNAHGLETLVNIKRLKPDVDVVMLSSSTNIELMLNCMDNGAADYVVKTPFTAKRIERYVYDRYLLCPSKGQSPANAQ